MEALDILTEWEAGADPKKSIKVMNIFDKTSITKEQVETHVNLVWADTGHRSMMTPKYFKLDAKVPTGNVDRGVVVQEKRQL
eukprot:14385588-Ditylum_brightwellii.AAC.2